MRTQEFLCREHVHEEIRTTSSQHRRWLPAGNKESKENIPEMNLLIWMRTESARSGVSVEQTDLTFDF